MNLLCKCLVLLAVAAPVYNAPRSKSKSHIQMETKYDQKQSGDYNIQVHLKDFQVVALLGGSSDVGDYEYNYDYADLTISPAQLSSTESSVSNATHQISEEASVKLNKTSTVAPSTSISTTPSTTTVIVTEKVTPVEKTTLPPKRVVTTEKVIVSTEKVSSTQKAVISAEEPTTKKIVSARINNKAVKEGKDNDEDVLEEEEEEESKKEEAQVPYVDALPIESKSSLSRASMHQHGSRLKKCGYGFARDKRGRCRKLKRHPPVLKLKGGPLVPEQIKRVASQLASRFRRPTPPQHHD